MQLRMEHRDVLTWTGNAWTMVTAVGAAGPKYLLAHIWGRDRSFDDAHVFMVRFIATCGFIIACLSKYSRVMPPMESIKVARVFLLAHLFMTALVVYSMTNESKRGSTYGSAFGFVSSLTILLAISVATFDKGDQGPQVDSQHESGKRVQKKRE